jgi:hypothetical protein
MPPQPPQVPQPQAYTNPAQYEFTDENNRTISELSVAMRAYSGLMYVLGLVFAVFLILTAVSAYKADPPWFGAWGFPVVLGAVTLICLAFGFWTSSAAGSFRKIVETRNQDVWHLMNALGSLKNMFGTLRTMIIIAIVLSVIGGILVGIGLMSGTTPTAATGGTS